MKTQKKFDALGLKQISKDVLLTLAKIGRSPASDIASYLNKPKPSVYDGLNELKSVGLVIEESDGLAKLFVLSKTEQINDIKKKQISLIETAFTELMSITKETPSGSVVRPRIRFYSGVEGIRQAFRDNQWTSKYKDAYLMWPMKEMADVVGERFLELHSEGRFRHGVVIHAISKHSDRKFRGDNDWLENNLQTRLREVRYASKDTKWNMSFWAYGDQTLFAGSGDEHFAFVIKSKDFTDLMIILWKQMWDRSEK
jgi:predicted transcriptional regulator